MERDSDAVRERGGARGVVPIRLPWITWPVPPLSTALPTPMPAAEPEMRLRDAGVVPPIVTLATPTSSRMSNELGLATMPVGSVPRKLPSMRAPTVVLYATWIAVARAAVDRRAPG